MRSIGELKEGHLTLIRPILLIKMNTVNNADDDDSDDDVKSNLTEAGALPQSHSSPWSTMPLPQSGVLS